MEEKINEYIEHHISEEPPLLAETYRYTHLHHLYPRMCSGHIQGRLLKMLTAMISPKRVLELGCYTGYSALCIAEGLPKDGTLTTIEIDDELEDELRERFSRSEASERINLLIGDCEAILPTLKEEWDMVFMDANKRCYPEYYEMVLPQLKKGGYIIADNTLWDGKVADEPAPTDPQTQGIMRFNDIVAQDPRVEKAIIPMRDGLTIIRKL